MPEGDVVARTAARLHAALSGRPLTASEFRWGRLATIDVTGAMVLNTRARGKHILTRLRTSAERRVTVHSHLRMEGSWHVHRTGEPWRARSAAGIRVMLSTDAWSAVGHRLGMLDVVETAAEDTLVGHLGPDLLGADWDPARALANLAQQPGRTVGAALLDQTNLAGIGTFYMSEALFLRGVNPWTPVQDVVAADGIQPLMTLAHRLLQVNVSRAVQSTTGSLRRGETRYVHARSGSPCRRCGATVRVAMIGEPPRDRTAFYCPRCQPGDVPADPDRIERPLGIGPPWDGA